MKNLNNRFGNAAMNYVEAWFDYHPEPFNIEPHEFLWGDHLITIFAADMVHDSFMIKCEFSSATKALQLENEFSKLVMTMGLSMIRINRSLFLFTDRRF
jgi:hypothetical protein